MNNTAVSARQGLWVPVGGLTLFAVAAGYLMSLLPLAIGHLKMSSDMASWLASVYYFGLLMGALLIEPIIARIGHRWAFVTFLSILALTVLALPMFPNRDLWLFSRFIAGAAVAGVFVVIESWLLIGNKKERAFRLGLYMTALYGGTTVGQFGIDAFGTQGFEPYIVIFGLLMLALAFPLLIKNGQPQITDHQNINLKEVMKFSKRAMIGCLVSGITMGTIYGLLPLALKFNGLGTQGIAFLMAAVVLGGMLIQPVVSMLSTRMNKSVLLSLSCLLGVFAMGLTFLSSSITVLAVALFLLGMSTFALYPIAITLACDNLASNQIVSATQVMLFCYSIGSVGGPLIANRFLGDSRGLMIFLFAVLLSTAVYLLIVSFRPQRAMAR